MIRLTKTGKLFLVVLVLFYFASLTSQSGLLLLLVGVLIACYLINLISAWRVVRQVEIHAPPSIHLTEGGRMSQPWRVTNRGCQAAGLIEAESPAGTLFHLASLGMNDTVNPVPELVYQRRGVFAHGQVALTSVYPFGFVKAARQLEPAGEVVVCPAVYETHAPQAAGFDVMLGGKLKGNRRTTSGAHFAGVRPHQPGDSLKHIHWKSSSKGQGLMVKTFDEELSGRVTIIMDSTATPKTALLDDCVRAAGSLIFAALDAGHHVEWIDLNKLEVMLIPPFADGQEILDALARVDGAPSCLTRERLLKAVQCASPKSAISFVVTDCNDALRQTMEELVSHHRHVALYLPEASPLPGDLGGVPLFNYSASHISERA